MHELPTHPRFDDVLAAAARIAPHAHVTPVLHSRALDGLIGATLAFKGEHLQRIGAFKFRGACNAVWSLDDATAARGVVTHSSGNHGAALALAATLRGIPCHVVVPAGAVRAKLAAIEHYGAVLHHCAPTIAAREALCAQVQAETGATPVHPYTDPRVIAGQGTATLELIREVGRLDAVIAPISGGGLLAGSAIAACGLCPGAEVFGAEPTGADDAARSFASGTLQTNASPDTISDGLRADLGAPNFAILQRLGTCILTVTDAETLAAMRLCYERLKIVIEPSCATPLAAILKYPQDFAGKRVGVILSGGNVDLDALRFST